MATAAASEKREARRREQREQVLGRLFAAVERLVEEGDSYANLSVDRLTEEAGTSRSTFYKYFGDKSGLLLALSEAIQVDFLAAARAWFDLPPRATKQQYADAFATIFRTYRVHRSTMGLIVEGATYDPIMRVRFAQMMDVFIDAIATHVRAGQAVGVIAQGHDATQLSTWLTWMLEGGQFDHIGPAAEPEIPEHVTAVTEIVWKSLYSAISDQPNGREEAPDRDEPQDPEVQEEPHASRKEQLAERLLPVVERLLAERQGLGGVSVSDILVAAELPRTTFYRYFSDKTELLLALAERAFGGILKHAMRPWELHADLTQERLERELRRTIDAYVPHLTLLGAMVEASSYDVRARTQFQEGFGLVTTRLAERLREGQDRGFIRASLPAEETAGWITWMAERGMSQLVADADEAGRQRLAASLAGLVWHGVYDLDG